VKRASIITTACILCWLLIPGWQQFVASAGAGYCMQLGSRIVRFDHLPVVQAKSQLYISTAVLDELQRAPSAPVAANQAKGKPLGGRSDGQDEEPEESAAADRDRQSVVVVPSGAQPSLLAPPGALAPPKAGFTRYKLARHALDIAPVGQPFAALLDNKALTDAELLEFGGQRYLAANTLRGLGLLLGYDSTEELYQLAGLIYQLDYVPGAGSAKPPSFTISCLTPLRVEGAQGDDGVVTLVAHGGFLADSTPRIYDGDPVLTKVGLKSQPDLGRAFFFFKQPQRTGFKIASDPRAGFARITFGNYFQVVSYNKSSSGEISLNVQLGASCKVHDELLASPPRLVIDFDGAVFDEASQTIKVNQGRVQTIRVGTPEPGIVRVVLDLSERVDYRVLPDDNGARYYIQLLPPTERTAPVQQRRLGRTIMLDPGHGGSDPGAPGVIPGVWEAPLNLQICQALAEELRRLGYDVLLTRTKDRFTSLGARTDYANGVLPYLFVSVHCNSIENPAFQGLMTFCHPASLQGSRLAQAIHEEVLGATGAVDKSVRTAKFFVLRETVMPSALVECGFVTNADECRKLTTPAYQRQLAQGIARGIDRYITGGF
jgi:N-acetylmuramoyl-L-alanine amidase